MSLAAGISMPVFSQEEADSVAKTWLDQEYNIGVDLGITRRNSTASVSVIRNDEVNERSAKNIGNSLIGHGKGLITLQNSGTYYAQNPTFYVRGLQSLSGSTPLILIDGIERDIALVDPDEVLEVQILKDAAATALYGYKGADGVINVITKRGDYNSRNIRVNYEHVFSNMTHRPNFVDGATYAKAMNEALYNEGQGQFAKYSQQEIDAFVLLPLLARDTPFQLPDLPLAALDRLARFIRQKLHKSSNISIPDHLRNIVRHPAPCFRLRPSRFFQPP